MITNLTKMILSIIVVIVTAGVITYFVIRRRRNDAAAKTVAAPAIEPAIVASSSGSSSGGSSAVPAAVPSAATNLTAVAAAGVTNLSWLAPTSGNAPTGYRVMRRTGSGEYAQIGSTVAAPIVIFADTAITTGVSYDYQIVATNNAGNAPASNTATATALAPANGFVITGVGQNVTGASPQQSWHTVTAPVRVINLLATPSGTYTGSATLKNAGGVALHTETFGAPGLNISAAGYPAIYFNPLDPVWNVNAAGTYTMEIVFNIAGTNYTRTTPITITAQDLGQGSGVGGSPILGEPSDPNADVEMIVDPYEIKGRFKIAGGSGTYNVAVKKGGATIATGTANYGTYAELTLKRFHNQEDLAGQTLTWEFEKAGNVTSVNFFTPELVHFEYIPEITFDGSGNAVYPDIEDRKLMLRYTKPFNSARLRLEDVGENLGMTPFYYLNGTIKKAGNSWDASSLSSRLVPALYLMNVTKFLVSSNVTNINDPNLNLFSGNYGVNGGKADFWIRTANNQNI